MFETFKFTVGSVLLIGFYIFLVIASFLGSLFSYNRINAGINSRDWKEINCRFVSGTIKERNKFTHPDQDQETEYTINIKYAFDVDDFGPAAGTNIYPHTDEESFSNRSLAEQRIKHLKENTKTAYYRPGDPSQSCLFKGIDVFDIALFSILGALSFDIFLTLLFGMLAYITSIDIFWSIFRFLGTPVAYILELASFLTS